MRKKSINGLSLLVLMTMVTISCSSVYL